MSRVSAGRRPWLTAWLLFGFMLVNFADKTVLGLCADDIMHDLHLSRAQFGQAASAFFALFSLSALLVPMLTRRVRSSRLLLVLAVLWSAAQLPVAAGAGFAALLGTRLLLGAAEGPAAPVAMHHLLGWFRGRERALPTALVLSGAAGGVAVAGPVITAVTAAAGWRAAFGLVAVAGLVWAAAWLLLAREPEPAFASAPEPVAAAGPLLVATAPVGYRALLLSRTVLSAAFGAFAAYWLLAASLTWMPDYVHQVLGLSKRAAGLVTMGAGLTSGAVLLAHAALGRRRGSGRPEGRSVGLLMALSAVAVLTFALGGPVWLRILMLLGPMALANVVLTSSQTAIARVCPPERRGVVLGAVACVYGLAGVLSPLVIGRVVSAAGSVPAGYRTAFVATGVLVAVAAAIVGWGLDPERDATRLGLAADGAASEAEVVGAS